MTLLKKRSLPPTVSLPVWVVSRNSEHEPPKVFAACQFWSEPAMVEYSAHSFEVISDAKRIRERKPGETEPSCWQSVEWHTVLANCFDKDPRILSKFSGGHPPAPFSTDKPTQRVKLVLDDEDQESPPPLPLPNDEVQEPPPPPPPPVPPAPKPASVSQLPLWKPLPNPFEGMKPLPNIFQRIVVESGHSPASPEEADKERSSKKPKSFVQVKGESELRARLRAFAFDHSSVMPPACDVSSGIFTGISEKGLDLQRAVQHVRCFTPEGTLKTQRNAVRRLMELLDFIPELNAEALKDPLRAGDLMEAFFVARAGIPTQRPPSWKPVKPLTALTEVFLISSVLAHAGLSKPNLLSLNAAAKKLGTSRSKKTTSPKMPLTFQHLQDIWTSPLMATPVDLRNLAMFAVGFFFLLRGINVRELRKKDLNFDATSGSWKVFVDHQKNDPLILGQEGTAQGAIQWAGNQLLNDVLSAWMQAASGWEQDSFLFPMAKVTGAQSVQWKGRENRFDTSASLSTSQHLNEWIQKSLKSLKPSENFDKLTFHSARVGGATAIFASTHSEALVRRMGNWRSEAF